MSVPIKTHEPHEQQANHGYLDREAKKFYRIKHGYHDRETMIFDRAIHEHRDRGSEGHSASSKGHGLGIGQGSCGTSRKDLVDSPPRCTNIKAMGDMDHGESVGHLYAQVGTNNKAMGNGSHDTSTFQHYTPEHTSRHRNGTEHIYASSSQVTQAKETSQAHEQQAKQGHLDQEAKTFDRAKHGHRDRETVISDRAIHGHRDQGSKGHGAKTDRGSKGHAAFGEGHGPSGTDRGAKAMAHQEKAITHHHMTEEAHWTKTHGVCLTEVIAHQTRTWAIIHKNAPTSRPWAIGTMTHQ
ncbi:hypothetical protein TanjilG_13696 [Lupinus angustifolius]|uniref:Uncharacterized protein n=1 Tax=Lupinus angustifolius TaxID=3871 RepID=A0A1J7GWB6_LUPAN|nr:hypothetical protein TanjilG_13696 [Lupinus angustifolius]